MADLGIIDSEIGFAEWENRQWEELSEAEKIIQLIEWLFMLHKCIVWIIT